MLCVVTGLSVPASAQVVQSLQLGFGGFFPRGLDSRASADVLAQDLNFLTFQVKDFHGLEVSGEWNVAFGNHIEATFGTAYYQRHVNSFYTSLVNTDGTNITQQLGLRIIPLTAGVRFLPFGKMGHFQPYVGAGLGALNWRYTEVGQFVDPNNNVFSGRYSSSGTTVAPIVFGGAKVPIAGDIYAITMEVRYQGGAGTLDASQQFAGSQIDLSGFSTRMGLKIRF
jgi:outer membrane protein W